MPTDSTTLEGNPFSPLASSTKSNTTETNSTIAKDDNTNPSPKGKAVGFATTTIYNSTTGSTKEEELQPLTKSTSSTVSNTAEYTNATQTVNNLKQDLYNVQTKLEKALRLQSKSSSDILQNNKHAGHVDVDFVRTKPKLGQGKLKCKPTKNVKTILHSFHAEFPEGCVTALMGPSGAGKTTLLDFLTGMLGDSVHASGQVALPDDDAYVPQDDRLHGFFTCQMYMEHYARLTGMKPLFDCCSSKKNNSSSEDNGDDDDEEWGENGTPPQDPNTNNPTQDVDKLITNILSEVGLINQRNTVVGGMFKRGLSGGQKRRLSVALEALSSPLNLFLDEPTSGLDSESALALMEYLHSYARGTDPITGRRRRVIVTIHQPSSQIWEVIDNVVLLAEGRLMYQGARKNMNDFFSSYGHPVPMMYNPADHFIEVLSKTPTADDSTALSESPATANSFELWSRCFREFKHMEVSNSIRQSGMSTMKGAKSTVFRRDSSTGNLEKFANKMELYANRKYRNAIELSRRSFVNLIKNPVVLGLRVVIYAGMSLVVGILFFNLTEKQTPHSIIVSRTALLYFIMAFCSSMSVAVIPFAMLDKAIVEKEVRNHLYHPALYHASQTLAGIPVCLILSVLVTVIILPMTGLTGGVHYWFLLFLTFLCADATSMFVAHISPELISAICIASGLFGVFAMFMGFLVAPSQFPNGLGWLYYIPFMTYGFRSMMYEEFHNVTFDMGNKGDEAMDTIDNKYGGIDQLMSSDAADKMLGNNTGIADFTPDGNGILRFFEMDNVDIRSDMRVLVFWWLIMHAISIIYLCWTQFKSRRIFIYSDS